MSEETQTISNNQKNTDIKSIFLNNKKYISAVILILLIVLFLNLYLNLIGWDLNGIS